MSREILFKAKRLDNGEWIEGYYQKRFSNYSPKFEGVEHLIFTSESPKVWEYARIDFDTLCQYTGLTDKNGNKIWENDVVDFLGHKGNISYECGSFGIAYKDYIDWEEIEANICTITGCDNALYACENDNFISLWEIYWNFNDEDNSVNTVEVISNIFDNPELMKEGAE